jgi:hypothetical protein
MQNDYRILCTGNPNDFTVARAVKQIFPDAEFACRSTGYDLRMWNTADEEHFKKNIVNYNVLINSSFIANGAQQKILEVTYELWKDKNSHVFNIGSTAEYEGRNSFLPHYSVQKRALRDISLSMCSGKFKTTHMTVGGLNDNTLGNENNLDPVHVATAIKWILDNQAQIPVIGIEQFQNER